MKYVIELMGGKNIEVSEIQAAQVDQAWQAKEDITINGVAISTHQITSIWPYDVWRDAENDRRSRRGQEPLPVVKTTAPLQIEAGEREKELTATGKLWLEAIKRNKSEAPYGKWEVADGKLSQTASYNAKAPESIKVVKTTKMFSQHDFNKFKQVPGYRVVNEDDNVLEYWARAV